MKDDEFKFRKVILSGLLLLSQWYGVVPLSVAGILGIRLRDQLKTSKPSRLSPARIGENHERIFCPFAILL
jgi:hypothetical protein